MEYEIQHSKSFGSYTNSIEKLKEFISVSTEALPNYIEYLQNSNAIDNVVSIIRIEKKENGSFKRLGFLKQRSAQSFIAKFVRGIIRSGVEKTRKNLPYHIEFIHEQSFIFMYSIFENYFGNVVLEYCSETTNDSFDTLGRLKDKVDFINNIFGMSIKVSPGIDEMRIVRNTLMHNNGVLRLRDMNKVNTIRYDNTFQVLIDKEQIHVSESILTKYVSEIDIQIVERK